MTSCTVVFEDVIKMSLLQKGQTNRTKNMVSVFYGIQCFWNNFELNMIIMTNYNPDHNTSASKTVRFVHTLFGKMFHILRYTRQRSPLKLSGSRDSLLERVCCQVWSLQGQCATAQASLVVLWYCFRIGPTSRRLARSPYLRSLLRTVWPEIRTFIWTRCSRDLP